MGERGLILGIESSCDETAAAVVERGARTLSSVVASQIAMHARYGGVVPELASREHLRAIDSHIGKNVIDYVVANRKTVSSEVASRYHAEGAEQVEVDRDKISRMKVKLILDNLLEEHAVIRHNSPRLARLLVDKFL